MRMDSGLSGGHRARGKLQSLLLVAALFLLASPALSRAGAVEALREDLGTILADPALSSAHVGVVVDSLTTGQRIIGHNARKGFVPASNMKLLTTAAALLALSPDFRYATRLLADGTIASGILTGNLVIEGSGDPAISGYFYGGDVRHVFRSWAKKLEESGVRQITGDLLIDNSLFQGRPHGKGWDFDTTSCFSAPRDGFTFNNNCIQLDISPPARPGDGPRIVMEPATDYVRAVNELTGRQKAGQDIIKLEYTSPRTLSISGSITAGSPATTRYVSVNHPAYFGGFVFRETLAAAGIAVKGDILCARNCPKIVDIPATTGKAERTTVAVHYSPPLAEIIKVVNKLSNNLYAELLLLAVGRAKGATTTDGSASVALDILRSAGVDTRGVVMADGSGLSRYNLVTPESIAQSLRTMAQGPYASYFLDSLPVMSVDGTLTNRLKDSPAAGRIRAKTGSMTHVRSLSGYLTARNGERFVFSIFSNNHTAVSAVDEATDRIVLRLLDYPSPDK